MLEWINHIFYYDIFIEEILHFELDIIFITIFMNFIEKCIMNYVNPI